MFRTLKNCVLQNLIICGSIMATTLTGFRYDDLLVQMNFRQDIKLHQKAFYVLAYGSIFQIQNYDLKAQGHLKKPLLP